MAEPKDQIYLTRTLAIARNPEVRRFLKGRRGIVESYRALWHGRGWNQEQVCVRVDRYRHRCEIVGQVLKQNEELDWQPARWNGRVLTPFEWEEVSTWVEAGLWRHPRAATAGVMDGDSWSIE